MYIPEEDEEQLIDQLLDRLPEASRKELRDTLLNTNRLVESIKGDPEGTRLVKQIYEVRMERIRRHRRELEEWHRAD